MTRHSLLTSFLVLWSGAAGAQPAPAPVEPAAVEPAAMEPAAVEPAAVEPAPPSAGATVEEPKQADKPRVTAKYDGGLRLSAEDGSYELKLSFRNQVRFESNRPFDEESATRHNQFASSIYIPRSRLQAEGHAFGKDNRFKVEIGLGDTGSFSFIKDMFLEKRLPDSPVHVRVGQWKRPFNRAEIVSDFASTFNERSIQNELAGGGRSLGVAVHNDYERSPEGVEWVVGVFNTFNGSSDRPAITTSCTTNAMTGAITCVNSRPVTAPADFGPTVVARAGWNSARLRGYNEGDLEGGPLRYGVGASYKIDLANFAKQMRDSWADNMSHGLELDAIVKAMGYSLNAGIVMMIIKDADPQYGLFVQPSMMVVPNKAEVGLRFAMVTLTVPGAMAGETVERNQLEGRAAFNYYWQGHAWKVSSDVGFLMLTGDQPSSDRPDLQVRVMMQMSI